MTIDWSQPIEWNDGTPAEIVYPHDRFGSMGIYIDRDNLPTKFTHGWSGWEREGRPFVWVWKNNGVPDNPAHYTPMKPPYQPPRIRNVSERQAEEAMEALGAF